MREGIQTLSVQKRGRKTVAERLAKNKDKIELFYLPVYSQELNPDKYLNNDIKLAVHGNNGGVARIKNAIRKKTVSHLRHLQKTPEKV